MGKKFLAEVETDEYYHVEIKELSKSEYIRKDKIREKIEELEKDKEFKSTRLLIKDGYKIQVLQELLEKS